MAKSYLVGLVGESIEHSLTPDLHMREARELGLDYEFRLIDIANSELSQYELSELLAAVTKAGYDAVNVTFPIKQKILDLVQKHDEDVTEIGACNLILNLQGERFARNTDWSGFEFALCNGLRDAARDLVIQVGAGGAGSATAYALLKWGTKELLLADVDYAKAAQLAASYQRAFSTAKVRAVTIDQALSEFPNVSGVVQATPIGMYVHPGMPFAIDNLNSAAWLADVVYRPIDTELVKAARSAGHLVLSGELMAIGQAVDSLRLITGIEPNIERMTAHFNELLADESVLTRARGI